MVVGSHDVDPIEHSRVGSVSKRVAQPATCPVLVAPGQILRRAIVAIAGTEATAHALAALARRLRPAETERTVIHVQVSFFRGLGTCRVEDRQLGPHQRPGSPGSPGWGLTGTQGEPFCFLRPRLVNGDLLADLWALIPLAPEHMPAALAGIEVVRALYPQLPQIVCFESTLHRKMPWVARIDALPREFYDAGIVRHGFHGLSYEYILPELRRRSPAAAEGRRVVAHLGSGASMAAIRGGVCVDTSMGFTPLAGLVMGSRCGDLDPGVVLYLLRLRG